MSNYIINWGGKNKTTVPQNFCFAEGTQIKTPVGDKSIDKLKEDDIVYAFDLETNSVVTSFVTDTFISETDSFIILNDDIRCTPNHRFYSNNSWTEIGKLSIGDKIFYIDNTEHIIESIKFVEESIKVYNIEVDKYNNYFAEGYLVHNVKESLELTTIVVSGSSFQGSSSIQTHEDMNVGDTVLAASIEGLPDTDVAAEFLLWEYTGSDITSQITLVTSSIESITTSSHQDYKLIETSGKSEPLKISDNHPLLAKSGSVWAFEYVGDIDTTYTLVSSSLEEVNIMSINEVTGSPATGSFRRFDIEPQDTYFADGILIHN